MTAAALTILGVIFFAILLAGAAGGTDAVWPTWPDDGDDPADL